MSETLSDQLVIAEYNTLRSEILLRFQSWCTCVQFGFTTPAVGIFFLMKEEEVSSVVWLALAFLIIVICCLAHIMEASIHDIACQIAAIEQRYRASGVQGWETQQVQKRQVRQAGLGSLQKVLVYTFPLFCAAYCLHRIVLPLS
ncbi:hypothetical protein [Rhizobium paknamense]|uniref:Uncharacterized protein n=1 Tax=Rhizobium paknamense TaxID=1206817 RepID=A0ABU0I913_9HYPH|nr:hypothetical protein [Rhizobium paknamense]MDQ0454728.1 hypothetical protein [Rhizobium paknamense]